MTRVVRITYLNVIYKFIFYFKFIKWNCHFVIWLFSNFYFRYIRNTLMYFSKKKDHSINMIQTWYVDINIKKRQQIHVHVLLDKLHYPTIVLYFQDKLFRCTYLLIVLLYLRNYQEKTMWFFSLRFNNHK